jgi:ABC-type multidrug transport system fused ATPase/permease subunit
MYKILSLLSTTDKQRLVGLLFFSVVVSIIEIVGISAIMPFIQIVTNSEIIYSNQYLLYIYKILSFKNEVNFVIFFGIILVLFYILRGVINLIYVHSLAHFTQSRYRSISVKLFQHYMNNTYGVFTNHNSSVMTKNIISEAQNLTQIISSLLFIISETFIFVFIYILMIYIDWEIAFFITCFMALNALLMLRTISRKIKHVGGVRAEALTSIYENINNSFGNFKIIKLQVAIEKYVERFKKSSERFTRTNITNITLTNIPRLFFEAVGFSLIITLITYLVWKHEGDIVNVMPTLTIFIMSLYRLMPSINRITTGFNEILFYRKSLDIIFEDLSSEVEMPGEKEVEFSKEIVINNLDFGYQQNNLILKNISLKIKKGSSVAFIGKSGSGKSTLVDVIMGLHNPNNGTIYSDGEQINNGNLKSWRKKIGYIPQSVYLFDGTVGENIILGSSYDRGRVDSILEIVKLFDFLKTKDGQDTHVGENGTKLSGGQKQRVAIARALYTNADILVLDEATSALDTSTEKQIMNEIYNISGNKTLIIIAHRLSTLDRCDIVYEMSNGIIKDV